ncbi:hypothetical protein [Erwinia sp. E602]|uniref:hypothetical protein n=1 Tax=Erwinia sp. E602 TaxID=2675378 RepID=UPI001BADCC72|nr:hypothetical protein [Erwinia sp. E602]
MKFIYLCYGFDAKNLSLHAHNLFFNNLPNHLFSNQKIHAIKVWLYANLGFLKQWVAEQM